MMKKLLYLLPLAVVALQCREKVPEPVTTYASAELKALARFRPGTYWVYRDSASAVKDSVWVTSLDSIVAEEKMEAGSLP